MREREWKEGEKNENLERMTDRRKIQREKKK
jgi:hypothetical protein